ncbi:MAG: methyltransferase, partial [Acidobacteriota bacterium]
ESICLDLFEPAARHMGKLWAEEACSDMDVTAGVCRLQALTRHLGAAFRARIVANDHSRSVLLATQPGEPHMLGVGLAAQFFWQAGWNVLCEFPASDDALATLVSRRWVDLLDLSLSGVFTREHRLLSMSKTIAAARAASQNPAMVIGSVWFFATAIRTLGKQWSLAARVLEGHKLVTEGPYRIVRNPIYTAMFGMLLATGVAISHWSGLLIAIIVFAIGTVIRVHSEEKLLREAFGAEFEAYAQRVPAVVPFIL